MLILLVFEVLLVGSVVFVVSNFFFHEDHQARIQGQLNEKRLSRIEKFLRDKGELDSRGPWS